MYRQVVETVRRGAFDWVAAEAAGISRSTYYRWMARGERGEQPYDRFAVDVRRAKAQARIGAEQWVRDKDPLSWLRLGPGRERRGEPGWTQPAEAQAWQAAEVEAEQDDPAMVEEMVKALNEVGWDDDDAATG